jgi:hypothetical protein
LPPLAIIVKRALLSILAFAATIYVGDYAFLRMSAAYPRWRQPFDAVEMDRLYAIPLKNGATEYELDARQPKETVKCVRALFPHLGYSPCWYLRQNSQKPIPMVILTFARP